VRRDQGGRQRLFAPAEASGDGASPPARRRVGHSPAWRSGSHRSRSPGSDRPYPATHLGTPITSQDVAQAAPSVRCTVSWAPARFSSGVPRFVDHWSGGRSKLGEVRKSALIVRDRAGHLLMTRERGKATYAFPGGKLEAHESAEAALHREIREELGVDVSASRLIGVARGETVDGRALTIYLYVGSVDGSRVSAHGEIEELRWVTLQDIESNAGNRFTPITTCECMPFLRSVPAPSW
jgi:8-oxo-dGTP diphosphatase